MAVIFNTADLPDLTQAENDWVYNGLDCCITLEVFEKLVNQLDDTSRKTYEFSKALQAPVMEMSMRGLRVDRRGKDRALRQLRQDISRLEDQLTTIIRDGIGIDLNWRSPKQLGELFYDIMGLPVIRKRTATGYSRTTDREAIERLSQYYWAEPLCAHMLLLRDLDKKRQFLETGIDTDGRMRTLYNIAGTNTGRLSASESIFGTGTNLMNVGRSIRSIFIADPGMKFCNIDLEQADSRNVGAINWNLYLKSHGEKFAGAYLDACESGDLHTTVCRMAWTNLPWTGDRKADRAIANQTAYRLDSYRDLAKKLGHGCLTAEHEVLTPNGWVSIAEQPETIMQWSPEGSAFTPVERWTAYNFTGDLHSFEGGSISALMTPDHRVPFRKTRNAKQLYEQPAEQGPGDHIPLGGGYTGGDKIVPARLIAAYMCAGRQLGDRMVFRRRKERLIQLCEQYGRQWQRLGGEIHVKYQAPQHPGGFMFEWTRECLADFVDELKYWCGYTGKTSVTLSSTSRENLEWFQTFGRLVGVGGNIQKPSISGYGSIIWRLQQNRRQNADGYVIKHATHPVRDTPVYCPTVPSSWFYIRHNGKISVTGNSNYRGKPPTMAKHSKVPQKMIMAFQRNYFSAFPTIPLWHQHVANTVKNLGYITTLLGRRRFFYGRPSADPTLNEAVAYAPQSMTADEVDIGILRLWRAHRVQLLLQVHDSILFQYPEELEDEIVPWALEQLKVHIPLEGGRDFHVPVEAKVGWNYGDKSDTNPDGLEDYAGHDTRKREYKFLTNG